MKWTGVLKSQDFQSRQSHSPGPQEAKGGFGPGAAARSLQGILRVLKPATLDADGRYRSPFVRPPKTLYGTKNLQRLTTPVSVIASARGFTGILKAERPQGNPAFLAEEGPIFLTRLVVGSATGG